MKEIAQPRMAPSQQLFFLFSSIPVFENEQQDATAEPMVGRCQEMREKGEIGQQLANM